MSQPLYDRTVRFRASSAMIEAATNRARIDGMTLPEMLRASLRNAARTPATIPGVQ